MRKMSGFAELTMEEMNSVEGGLLLELIGIIYSGYKLYDYCNDLTITNNPHPYDSLRWEH